MCAYMCWIEGRDRDIRNGKRDIRNGKIDIRNGNKWIVGKVCFIHKEWMAETILASPFLNNRLYL